MDYSVSFICCKHVCVKGYMCGQLVDWSCLKTMSSHPAMTFLKKTNSGVHPVLTEHHYRCCTSRQVSWRSSLQSISCRNSMCVSVRVCMCVCFAFHVSQRTDVYCLKPAYRYSSGTCVIGLVHAVWHTSQMTLLCSLDC